MSEVKEDPELIAILPVEASMSGRNAFYQFCDARQQQVNYAVCLHTLKAIEEDRLARDQFTDCQRYYCHNTCPAKGMREEERKAGHALYFKERPRHVYESAKKQAAVDGAVSSGKYDMSNPSYARGWAIGGREGYSTDKPIPKRQAPRPTRNIGPIKKSGFVEEGMADVVNVLMKEHAENKAAPTPTVAATPAADQSSTRPLPGESTADFIKRRAAMKLKAGK
jgi:NAD-dependent dihydropyrimidine dehydrogenase PreA subunit